MAAVDTNSSPSPPQLPPCSMPILLPFLVRCSQPVWRMPLHSERRSSLFWYLLWIYSLAIQRCSPWFGDWWYPFWSLQSLHVLGVPGRSIPCFTSLRSSVTDGDREELSLLVSHTLLFSAHVTFRRLMSSSPFSQHHLKHSVVDTAWC